MLVTPEKIFAEIDHLHSQNIANAQETAKNAVIIGVRLHQAKELVPHGQFEELARKRTKLNERTAQNYMRLAKERLIEHRAIALLGAESHSGKSETVSLLPPDLQSIPSGIRDQAREFVESETFKWIDLEIKPKELAHGLVGKEISELYRLYGVIRDKKPAQHHPRKPLNPAEELAAQKQAAVDAANRFIADAGLLQIGTLFIDLPKDKQSEVEDARLSLGHFIKANLSKKPESAAKKKLAELAATRWDTVKAKAGLKFPCDQCGCDTTKENPVIRCRHCAHYFCPSCHDDHKCGDRFICAEESEKQNRLCSCDRCATQRTKSK